MGILVNLENLKLEDHPHIKGVKIGFVLTKAQTQKISVTVLEIDEGAEVPIHTHEKEVDTVFVIEGKGEIFLDDEWKPLKKGDIIIIFPGEQHGVKAKDKLCCYIAHAPALW